MFESRSGMATRPRASGRTTVFALRRFASLAHDNLDNVVLLVVDQRY